MSTATLPIAAARLPTWLNSLLAVSAMLLALSCLAGGAPPVSPQQNMEHRVKAAFLYKFLSYVEFQGDAPAQFTVGVIGADDVLTELQQITNGRSVNNRPIVIKAVAEGDLPAGLQMLFVGADAARPVETLRNATQNSVLSVTESENGLQQGSVINFRLVEERVRFEVSLPAADKSNLRLSSRLLSVAYHVQKGGQ